MTSDDSTLIPIKENSADYVAASLKAALGAVPLAGSMLAEVAGLMIPKQRVDRIADFAAKLEQRISHLEKEAINLAVNSEEFTDLVEEAIRQATRATTNERREYLSSMLANSLSSDAITYAETNTLCAFSVI